MSQIPDVGPWLAAVNTTPIPPDEAAPDADRALDEKIPPLPVDRRRRPLPLRGPDDRYAYQLL